MKTSKSKNAGITLVQVMVVIAIVGFLATIVVRQIDGTQQWGPDMAPLVTRLKWAWMAVFISSGLAAPTLAWLRTPGQSGKLFENIFRKHQDNLQPR